MKDNDSGYAARPLLLDSSLTLLSRYPIGTSMMEPGDSRSPLPIRRQRSTPQTVYLRISQAIS